MPREPEPSCRFCRPAAAAFSEPRTSSGAPDDSAAAAEATPRSWPECASGSRHASSAEPSTSDSRSPTRAYQCPVHVHRNGELFGFPCAALHRQWVVPPKWSVAQVRPLAARTQGIKHTAPINQRRDVTSCVRNPGHPAHSGTDPHRCRPAHCRCRRHR